jgi:hypothetical protein
VCPFPTLPIFLYIEGISGKNFFSFSSMGQALHTSFMGFAHLIQLLLYGENKPKVLLLVFLGSLVVVGFRHSRPEVAVETSGGEQRGNHCQVPAHQILEK